MMLRILLLMALGFGVACRSTRGPPVASNDPPPFIQLPHGRVVRVNPTDAYVILECTRLPIRGEEITLYREKKVSGSVRVSDTFTDRWVAADIVSGEPALGDWFRLEQTSP